uniref:Large ribosomal subunit protein bL20c n=2 Tax=Euglena gracilis TaxID=3039 RepID=RK20_EUGGR|nr:ribosomal protein L20 [Euglena gracilis]P07133.3 RecName: Full=Large ribosomal subunit protein bL20c; AltName: Full=50S ribosomal protein L20, chloroplastic [Euglena gracilis]AKL82357.1 ribosomal protein L20 [Euglena gracilis var. bacillaris]CAA50090.1 50S ribosomal protein L20 [Euglena gracilis]CAA68338.1 unnamed protein product [Euglena gracilis]CAA77907.1 ribosomal protein L20 [Euglena gracilis]
MTRIKNNGISKKKRKRKISKMKGWVGGHSKLFRTGNQQLMKARHYAFYDRKKKKNLNKTLWITRINGGLKYYLTINEKYNIFVSFLRKTKTYVNKKLLSEINVRDSKSFSHLSKPIMKSTGINL